MAITVNPKILNAYGFLLENVKLQQIGVGLINQTYLLFTPNEKYILQNINPQVFKNPLNIANNINAVANYLTKHYPTYLFIKPIATLNGDLMFFYKGNYWRLLPFVPNTTAFETLNSLEQAYQAAQQFAKLSKLLDNFNVATLKPTIVGFHDLELRYQQFNLALSQASTILKTNAKAQIATALHHHFILNYYKSFKQNINFKDRVMHHDTKISNVLLHNDTNKGVCVIDLDTLMPGKFLSDLGDMMRTYLCAFSENEKDLDKITIRIPYFEATVKGYLSEMSAILTPTEKELILFAGKYMVYMQALRFLTDYFNGSIYYPISYPQQNLDRTKNQFKLLKELFENEKILQDIIEKCLS